MAKNFFKIAWRILTRNRVYSFINISGLAIGLACFLFIAAYVWSELDYDRYPLNANDIYRVNVSVTGNGDVAAYPNVDVPVGEGMKLAFPEIKASTRLNPVTDFIKFGDKQFKEDHLGFADSNFFDFFSIPLLEGNAADALVQPNSAVISQAIAKKYFGNSPALGQTLLVGANARPYRITGIFDKIPDNSHFHFAALFSLTSFHFVHPTWSNLGFNTYVLLAKNADAKKLEGKFPQLVERYVVPEVQKDMGVSLAEAQKSVNTFKFSLQPLTRIHLHAATKMELEPPGDIKYVYIFSLLAFFILLLACVNFTNLSTASAIKRAREVGVRKVLGSARVQLILQFISESVLMGLLALFIAYLLIFLLLPYFNQVAGKNISFGYFMEALHLALAVGLGLVTGICAGIYPAFFLSSFGIVKVLKGGNTVPGSANNLLRSGLIVFQFAVSIALIVSTAIVFEQLHYMQNKKLGYDKDQVLYLPDARLLGNNQTAFREQLMEDHRVVASSISRYVPGGLMMDGTQIYPRNESSNGTEIHANIYHVDYDYLKTLGLEIDKGRYFSKEYPTDSSGVVINEAAVRQLGWLNTNPIGKTIVRSGQQQFKVVGVVKDFHYASVKEQIAPLLLMLGNNAGGLILKIEADDIQGFLSELRKQWGRYNPMGPIEYRFLDEQFASLYKNEERTRQIFSAFAVLAVIIACLGLFGLSAFAIEQRTKELGIRKVLGASVRQVLLLVSGQFLKLVGIAFIVSVPVTAWAMHGWLQDFAYRVNMGPGVFAISGLISFIIAAATISVQAFKAAMAKPVKSLRSE